MSNWHQSLNMTNWFFHRINVKSATWFEHHTLFSRNRPARESKSVCCTLQLPLSALSLVANFHRLQASQMHWVCGTLAGQYLHGSQVHFMHSVSICCASASSSEFAASNAARTKVRSLLLISLKNVFNKLNAPGVDKVVPMATCQDRPQSNFNSCLSWKLAVCKHTKLLHSNSSQSQSVWHKATGMKCCFSFLLLPQHSALLKQSQSTRLVDAKKHGGLQPGSSVTVLLRLYLHCQYSQLFQKKCAQKQTKVCGMNIQANMLRPDSQGCLLKMKEVPFTSIHNGKVRKWQFGFEIQFYLQETSRGESCSGGCSSSICSIPSSAWPVAATGGSDLSGCASTVVQQFRDFDYQVVSVNSIFFWAANKGAGGLSRLSWNRGAWKKSEPDMITWSYKAPVAQSHNSRSCVKAWIFLRVLLLQIFDQLRFQCCLKFQKVAQPAIKLNRSPNLGQWPRCLARNEAKHPLLNGCARYPQTINS